MLLCFFPSRLSSLQHIEWFVPKDGEEVESPHGHSAFCFFGSDLWQAVIYPFGSIGPVEMSASAGSEISQENTCNSLHCLKTYFLFHS